MMSVKRFTALFFLVCCTAAAEAQSVSIEGLDTSIIINQALPSDIVAQRNEKRRARVPVLIVIPGIMGSELIDRKTGKTLWGALPVPPVSEVNLSYAPDQDIEPKVLEAFKTAVLNIDVYGNGLKKIAEIDKSDKDALSIFPYDWRQDNRKSADDLHRWLCDNRAKFNGRKVMMVAHSMGGLITKYWLTNVRSSSCANGSPEPSFSELRVMFVGVPFYGAPKALGIFANGFSHTDGAFGSIVGAFDRRVVSKYVNNYGHTFPSSYQLLPIYHDDCAKNLVNAAELKKLPPYLKRKTSATSETIDDDIFSADFWRSSRWPSGQNGIENLDKFYDQELVKLLDDALDFQCKLAAKKLPEGVKYTFFFNDRLDTPVSYEMGLEKPTAFGFLAPTIPFEGVPASGDGTVPNLVASGALDSVSVDDRRPLASEVDHMKMVNAEELWAFINSVIETERIEADRLSVSNEAEKQALIQAYAAAKSIPAYPIAGEVAEDTRKFYDDIVAGVLKANALSYEQAQQMAKETQDVGLKIALYNVVSRQGSIDPRISAFAKNNLAHVQLQNRQWLDVVRTAEELQVSETWANLDKSDQNEVGRFVFNTQGWANIELGDFTAAEKQFTTAIELGSPKAQAGLRELQLRAITEVR